MTDAEIIAFLQKNELTKDLTLAEITELFQFAELRTFQKGDLVFQEGEEGRELCLVLKGKLSVLKKVHEKEEQVGLITEGQFLGGMAYLEQQKRSATVRVVESAELLFIQLDLLKEKRGRSSVYSKIMAHLAKGLSSSLRLTDETLVASLREKLDILQAYNQIAKTLIYFVVLLAIWFNLEGLIKLFSVYGDTLSLIFTPILLILFALSALSIIRSSGYPLSFYGLTLQNGMKNSLAACLYSLPFLVFFVMLKWFLIQHIDMFRGMSLFATLGQLKASFWIAVVYIVMVPIQEIVARGCLQSCFRNFFKGPHRVFLAILISNLLFQVLHTTKEFWLAIVVLFEGFFWGYIFEKQKSIVGVSASHALMGSWGYFILDFDSVLKAYLSG